MEDKCKKCKNKECVNCCKDNSYEECVYFYKLCNLFQENVWSNIVDIDCVKDYFHRAENINKEYVFSNFMLYESKLFKKNILFQLEMHKTTSSTYYIVKFYKTDVETLKIIQDSYASRKIDKILSMKITYDKVNLLYSENLFADDILQICEELYNFIHNYMCGVRGLDDVSLEKESEILTKFKPKE